MFHKLCVERSQHPRNLSASNPIRLWLFSITGGLTSSENADELMLPLLEPPATSHSLPQHEGTQTPVAGRKRSASFSKTGLHCDWLCLWNLLGPWKPICLAPLSIKVMWSPSRTEAVVGAGSGLKVVSRAPAVPVLGWGQPPSQPWRESCKNIIQAHYRLS